MQGRCFSPFLFDMAIEPLAIALRAEKRIKGILRGKITHMVSLNADNILLHISNPVESIPYLLDMLQGFGTLSGYKFNLTKSVLLPINQLAEGIWYANFPFKVEHQDLLIWGLKDTISN